MENKSTYDVIIIGGSYAGLSAAMALGRALRKVLVIDSGTPCNRQTPYSHNFLTQDGVPPAEISTIAKHQVEQYANVQFYSGKATEGKKMENGFEIMTEAGDSFSSKKLILATGLKDNMPAIPGFAECWGISVLHCPYCHGYEVRNLPTGIIANGEAAFELAKMISNWTTDLKVFTNGPSTLSTEQADKLQQHNIEIIEAPIEQLHHTAGKVNSVSLQNNDSVPVKAIYAHPETEQSSSIPTDLGCELTPEGWIVTQEFQAATVDGIRACGDNSSFRSVATAVYSGSVAGVATNRELTEEEF